MSLSRKRRKALTRLKGTAEDLWVDQQAVLDRANAILREAGKQASFLADEEVRPRVSAAVGTVAPAISRNVAAAKVAGQTAKDRFASDVIPAVAGTIGSAAAVLQLARNPEFVQNAGKKASKLSKNIQKAAPKQSGGSKVGVVVLVTLGVVTVAGLGYALWQTFRADDELWIADEDPAPESNPEG